MVFLIPCHLSPESTVPEEENQRNQLTKRSLGKMDVNTEKGKDSS